MVKKRGQNLINRNSILDNLSRYWFVYLSLIVIFLFILFYFYFMMEFKIGDIVYKKSNVDMIGVIRAVSFSQMGYLIFWNDGSYGLESSKTIGKISDLPNQNKTLSINKTQLNLSSKEYTPKTNPISYYNLTFKESDFQDYVIEKNTGQKIFGIFYKGTSLGVNLPNATSCNPEFMCGDWGECTVDYELLNLINSDLPAGIQFRYCEDSNKCLPSIVDSRKCAIGENLSVKRINCGGQEIILINDNGNVVARIGGFFNVSKLNVDINLIEEKECNY